MRNLTARRSSFAGISVVAVMAVTLGACGGSSSPTSAPSSKAPATALSGTKVVLASVRTTAAEKSAREAMTISTKGSGLYAFSATTNGAVDFATGDSQFTTDLGGPAASFLPHGLEVRVVNKVAYMKIPESIGRFFGAADGKWLSINALKGTGTSNPFSSLGQSDPTKVLATLERVSDDAKEVGTATVRGVQTKHYRATIDLGKAIDNAKVPKSLRDKADQLFGGANAPTIPVDVFIDNDGRLRRLTLDMDLSQFSGTGASGVTGATGAPGALPRVSMTLDLYDFGTPVNVQAPPADQIISLKQFGMNGGGMFGGGSSGGSPAAVPSTKVS